MKRQEVYEKLVGFIDYYRTNKLEEITPESELMDLGVDSLSAAEILFEIENEFGIEIPLSTRFNTVNEVVDAILSRASADSKT